MKVGQIIGLVEKYYTLKAQLDRDIADYREYKIFDNDEVKAAEMKRKIEIDKEKLGKFLDVEV